MWLIESKMPRGKNYELTSTSSESWLFATRNLRDTDMTQCLQREKDNLINVLIEGSFLSCINLTVSIGCFLYI
jgi:hypothetical protein